MSATSSTNVTSVQSMLSKAKAKFKDMAAHPSFFPQAEVILQQKKVKDLEDHLFKLKSSAYQQLTGDKPGVLPYESNKVSYATQVEPPPSIDKAAWQKEPAFTPKSQPAPSHSSATVGPVAPLYQQQKAPQSLTAFHVQVGFTVNTYDHEVAASLLKVALQKLAADHPEIVKGFALDTVMWTDASGTWLADVGIDGKVAAPEEIDKELL